MAIMDLKYARCAGLDVHKDSVVACLRIEEEGRVVRTVKTFGTMTIDLLALQELLAQEGITHVAMEATGVYWKPVWHVLESVCVLILANAAHIKNVPGRKTDVKDAEWIGELLAHGLIEASFVPPQPIQELRALTRDRRQFHRDATQHVQRIQKVLQDANIKIDSVITDLMGKSGRRFLDAIVAGKSDPEELAKLSDPRLKASREQIVEALRGIVTPHHRAAINRHLAMYDTIQKMIAEIDIEVAALLEPFHRQVELLDTIPGIDIQAAQVIIAEIGVDMSRFPSAAHLVAWACLSPRNDQSAGKKRNTRIGNGGQWLKATLIQAAWAATRKKGSHLRALYLRTKGKRGPKKAIVAVAAEMLRSAWYMLSRNEQYKDSGDGIADPAQKERAAIRLVHKLKKLGYEVKVELPVAA
jgi:transposase